MQPAQVEAVVVVAPEAVVVAQIITLAQMTAEIQTWAAEELLDRDFQAARELDLIVKVMIVTKPVGVVAQVAQALVPRMIAKKDDKEKAVLEQPMIF
jgi:hypothetical protein